MSRQQQTLMKFDPANGWGNPFPSHAGQWREFNGEYAWLFNPWTGERRSAEDVGSDTFGHLILPPDEPVYAAPVEQAQTAPVVPEAPRPIAWGDIVKAIRAVEAEARRRGSMFPQTSDEQAEDRAATRRVVGMIEWYATKGGAVAEALPDWPRYSAAAPSAPIQANSEDAGWLPIETAPKDGSRIMLGCPESDEQCAISTIGWWQEAEEDGVDYMGGDAGFVDFAFQVFNPGRSFGNPTRMYAADQPTHWMPLPAAPAAISQSKQGGETA